MGSALGRFGAVINITMMYLKSRQQGGGLCEGFAREVVRALSGVCEESCAGVLFDSCRSLICPIEQSHYFEFFSNMSRLV